MLKKLALALMIATTAQAEITIERFELDEAISLMYLWTDINDFDPNAMLAINHFYKLWCDDIDGKIKSKDDIRYIARLSHMYAEVMLTYYFPQEDTLPTLP